MSKMSTSTLLDFERPIAELEAKVRDLRDERGVDHSKEIARLEQKAEGLRRRVFAKLAPLDRRRLARHGQRPEAPEFAEAMVDDLLWLQGDGVLGDDPFIVAGLGFVDGAPVAVLGARRRAAPGDRRGGGDATTGMRKARRLCALAERFALPLIAFIDRPTREGETGPSLGREAAALADALSTLPTPTVGVLCGELSGLEALALAACRHLLAMEHAVLAPAAAEEVAASLFDDPTSLADAARVTQLSAEEAQAAGIVEELVAEPVGGAHRDPTRAFELVTAAAKRRLVAASREVRGGERREERPA